VYPTGLLRYNRRREIAVLEPRHAQNLRWTALFASAGSAASFNLCLSEILRDRRRNSADHAGGASDRRFKVGLNEVIACPGMNPN
jgi:hypothetical protein